MRKAILFTMLCVCIQFLALGSTPIDFSSSSESLKIGSPNSALRVDGAKVFKDNVLLQKNEVLNILSSYPDISNQYTKGTGLRGTGTFLLIGGIVATPIGFVLMVDGAVKTVDNANSYNNNVDANYYIGSLVLTAGVAMIAGGITCRIVGKAKIRRAINNYNRTISNSSYEPGVINYQLGFLDNGKIGLKLTF